MSSTESREKLIKEANELLARIERNLIILFKK